MELSQIRQKLSSYAIDQLSIQSEFNLRGDAKVTLLNFLGGFFLSMSLGHSLRMWAAQISSFLPSDQMLSKAGLQKRLGLRQLGAVKSFVETLIGNRVKPLHLLSKQQGWFDHFGKVLVEDSVCVSLNPSLAAVFRGGLNHTRLATAVGRIQLCLDLKTLTYIRFALMGYRDNDQKWSPQILPLLSAGDLVIRDMGYSVFSVFEQIMAKGAFFLSRYKFATHLYASKEGPRIDLVTQLRQAKRSGAKVVDQAVWVGAAYRLPLRLVAVAAPAEVVETRIRKAKKTRNRRTKYNAAYFELLQWSIFLTNVGPDQWQAEQIVGIYGFRWHIEIIFKVWKSKFSLQRLMTQSQIKKPLHAQLFFFLFLAYVLLFYARYFHYFFEKVYQQKGKILSLFLFADFCNNHFKALILKDNLNQLDHFIDELSEYYCYEKRKDRQAQLALILQL